MVSPPKPWERGTLGATTASSAAAIPTASSTAAPTNQTPSMSAPSVPARPSSINSNSINTTNALSSQFNSSPYAAPYSNYAPPYNRLGAYGGGIGSYGMGYGGYGGYGMGYGSYGGYGGYGGMGMMQPPGAYDPNNPSLTQQLEATTQSTFALLQSIVQTFGGFAQMLESTFMATHSSFFAMVGVADQLGQLRNALGSVLGLFGLIRWLRSLITGKPMDGGLTDEFGTYLHRPPGAPLPNPNAPKPSRKPIIIFLLGIIGVPFLMHRLIRHLSARIPPNVLQQPIDPSKLVFARATYPFETKDSVELTLREGEIVAILGTADPVTGVEGDWWHGRTRDGRQGWFPKSYVQLLGNVGQAEPKKID